VKVGRRTVEIGNPDKILFPDAGLTKRGLAEYYRRVAETLLPHIRDRPLTMHRLPDGIDGEDFYQKDVPGHFPDWIRTVEVETKEGHTLDQLVADDAATLVYLADQACITPHAWLSRIGRLHRPDRMVFDFDPPDGTGHEEVFAEVRWAARQVRSVLEDVGLVAFVQTSGSRGLHVHVPLEGDADFDRTRAFARDLVVLLENRFPERLTTRQRKKERGDRIYLDVGRNAYGQTAVAPYAVRARPGAPVATPLSWDELGRSGLHPRRYTVENLFRRLGATEDPWKGMGRRARGLAAPGSRLDRLRDESTDSGG